MQSPASRSTWRASTCCTPHTYGAAGVTQFTPLAYMYASQRTLRIADGPDEVHKMTIARREIMKHDPDFRMLSNRPPKSAAGAAEPQVFMRP